MGGALMLIQGVLLLLIGSAIIFYVWCAIATWRFFSLKPEMPGRDQGVSVLVPVCGVDQNARSNWTSFCCQNHDHYQVLFGVMDPEDPAVPILKELVARFPERAQLIFCQEVRGVNHQISNLTHLLEAADHEAVIFADSDISVGPDYLSRVSAPLADPAIGVVTCPYVDHDPQFLGAALAALGRGIDFIPSVLIARSLDGGLRFALGPTIATRQSVLSKIGGLRSIANHIGSDYHIGKRAADAGFRVELSDYVLENPCGRETIWQVFQRELRWARTIRLNRGWQYYGLVGSYGTVYCGVLLLASGFQPWAVAIGLVTLVLRIIQAGVAIRSLDCPNLFRWLWALPIRDGISFIIWVSSLFGQSVKWRGRRLRIEAGGALKEQPGETV